MAYTRRRSSYPPKPARWMDLRYPGICHVCGKKMLAGTRGFYDPDTRQVTCTDRVCAEADGLATQVAVWGTTEPQTKLLPFRVGQPAPTVDGHPVEYHPDRPGVFRYTDSSDSRWFARTRHGIRAGRDATGITCEDAPCCGCCGNDTY